MQLVQQRLNAVAVDQVLCKGADIIRDFRNLGQAADQSREIQPRAADDDRQPAIFRVDQGRNIPQPGADGIAAITRHMPIQHMRGGGLVVGAGAGGQYAPASIDLQRIGVDDHPVVARRQLQRQRRFARCCRPRDQNGQGWVYFRG